MRANEEGTQPRPRIYTLDLASSSYDMATTDMNPYANDPHQCDITDIEIPVEGPYNPYLQEYLGEPILVDFATMAEGSATYLTFLQFDESPGEGKEPMDAATLRIRYELGQFTADYVNMCGDTQTDKNQEGTLEEVSFMVEPKAASIDGSYGVCVSEEGQLPQIRRGGYVLFDAYFPDIDHNDARLRIGPIVEAVQYNEQELTALFNNRPQ